MLSMLRTDMDYFSQLTTATCAHWSTLRRQIPPSAGLSTPPAPPSCPQFRHPLCPGQSQSLPSSQIQLPPSHCWDNKYLTPEHSAGPGCSRLPTARPGAADWQVAGGGELAGWRAASTPWPPATDPASRRASLPDTSPRRVTGHWVVSQARKDLRRSASSLRGPCRVPFTVLTQPGVYRGWWVSLLLVLVKNWCPGCCR